MPRFFFKRADGGQDSGVTGYWLIEWKALFSIVLLRFEPGSSRSVYHSHAFSAWTWWLRGAAVEHHSDGRQILWTPSPWPKWTPRSCCHRIFPKVRTWALSIRGPWAPSWREEHPRTGEVVHLGSGRKVLGVRSSR